jgi:predicted RNase H-like HicB family nuclease
MKYAVILECGPGDACGAYAPDLPGVVLAVGRSRDEVLGRMDVAIEMHLEALAREGSGMPPSLMDPTHPVEGLAHVSGYIPFEQTRTAITKPSVQTSAVEKS